MEASFKKQNRVYSTGPMSVKTPLNADFDAKSAFFFALADAAGTRVQPKNFLIWPDVVARKRTLL